MTKDGNMENVEEMIDQIAEDLKIKLRSFSILVIREYKKMMADEPPYELPDRIAQ